MSKDISLLEHFKELEDPRCPSKLTYPLDEIILVAICALICGAEGWEDFSCFGKSKIDFLRKFLPFSNGIPTKTTYFLVFASLDPEKFKACFLSWVKSLEEHFGKSKNISIDGKTLRHSFDTGKERNPIHMVSAFASDLEIVLGQQKADTKSNEITAIPKLLDLLSLEGALVKIDAMGCQKNITKKIRQKGGDYILALKENHKNLYTDVKEFMDKEREEGFKNTSYDYYEDIDKGHGRIEIRKCYITDDVNWIEGKADWEDFKTIAIIESKRIEKDKETLEVRYFISNLEKEAKPFLEYVRSHWGIENKLHWVLDVVFREDDSRIRNTIAAENIAIIRHTVLNMLKKAKDDKISIKRLRKKAGWEDKTLERILTHFF